MLSFPSSSTEGDIHKTGGRAWLWRDPVWAPVTADTSGLRNRLINGAFSEFQRASGAYADDAYCMDRWYVLTETGTVSVAQTTDPESGAPFGIRLTQPDASAKRIGFAQIIESRNIRQYAGQAMNLFGRVKLSAGTGIRWAVLEHTGTADSVTSDVVNNWASSSFTSGGFFIAGVNVLKTGVVTPGAATWGEIDDWAQLGANTKNVIVFVWTESQLAQNGTLDANRFQLESGFVRTPHEWRMNELALCQRYHYRESTEGIAQSPFSAFVLCLTTTQGRMLMKFPVVMRVSPVALEQSGVPADFQIVNGAGNPVLSLVPAYRDATPVSTTVDLYVASGLVAGQSGYLRSTSTNNTFLAWSAEL